MVFTITVKHDTVLIIQKKLCEYSSKDVRPYASVVYEFVQLPFHTFLVTDSLSTSLLLYFEGNSKKLTLNQVKDGFTHHKVPNLNLFKVATANFPLLASYKWLYCCQCCFKRQLDHFRFPHSQK